MKFVWKNLPVFFIWLIGLSVLNNSLHHISPPVEGAGALSLFPLGASLILLWFAFRREYSHSMAMRRFAPWAIPMAALYAVPVMHGSMMPLDLETQRIIYELSALLQFGVLVVHGRTWLRSWDWLWVFGVTLAFGMILENGGIILGVFIEPGYLLTLPGLPAPLATALGWVNVLYCAFFAVEKVLPAMGPVWRGMVCALIGLSLDIPFDPVATRLQWWVWDRSLDARIWGVPVINFVAWFWALFPYGAVYYWVRGKEGWSEKKRMGYLVAGFPVILVTELLGVLATLALMGDRAGLSVIRRFFSLYFRP